MLIVPAAAPPFVAIVFVDVGYCDAATNAGALGLFECGAIVFII